MTKISERKPKVEPGEPTVPVLDKKAFIKAERDEYQKRLDKFVKEAQKQVDMLQGAIGGCDEMLAKLELEEKPLEGQ